MTSPAQGYIADTRQSWDSNWGLIESKRPAHCVLLPS